MPWLCDLLNLPDHPLISIVGAGGKTTTMYTLAGELAHRGKRVITTTTTNIYFPRQGETETLIVAAGMAVLLKMISNAWRSYQRVTVAATASGAGKLAGLRPNQPYELLAKSGADVVIVEADGARRLMIKAPAEHEPVVPPQTNVALLVVSAGAINQPLSGEIAHRPERVAEVTGTSMGNVLTPAAIARLMTSEQGAMKHIPETARVYVLITHASRERHSAVRELAELIQQSARSLQVLASAEPGEWFSIL